ncbi:lysis inhibition [Serratia phage 92A1]|nr:lysis inhibition [Serratia phage 92A1]
MALLLRTFAALLISVTALSAVPSSANTGDFNEYLEGAMSVYSKFKAPSVEESEQFYAFIKSKWQRDDCSTQCTADGKQAGAEYATLYQVNLEK